MRVVPLEGGGPGALLAGLKTGPRPVLTWLGQAGFLIRWGSFLLMIDPYLSDSLAQKYCGGKFPHERMMPPPILPEEVSGLDAVLCTHAHTDHMDPDTLSVVAPRNPGCRFVVPRAARQTAANRGVPPGRTAMVNAGEEVSLNPGVSVCAVASAHEELERDADGNHHFLGFVLKLGNVVVYHSGDCVPYVGLASELGKHDVDVAILPVNGRDAYRRENGIPGNFTFQEAMEICTKAEIACMIPCHFGMFDFNTVDDEWLDQRIGEVPKRLQCTRLRVGQVYVLTSDGSDPPQVRR